MNINKLFDEYLDITTKDNKSYHIEYIDILIHDTQSFSGKANIIRRNNNVYLIKEVYSLEKNRLRYSYIKFEDVKAYTTIERQKDGKEAPIYVIETFKNKKTNIGSIGNINKITSDKIEKLNNKYKDQPLILKLLRRNKNGEVIEELLAA